MCKLKHLAVATAIIGLATHVQAGYFAGTTDFEGADTLSDGLWSNAVDVAIEVDATIGSAPRASNLPLGFNTNSRTKVLTVDSDDPVVRYLQEGRTAPTADTIYADALVKGNPIANDAVLPQPDSSDKILVYTRVNAVGDATNLCVYAKDSANGTAQEFVLTKTIGKDEWHRIVIKATASNGYQVYCDGVEAANLCKTSGDVATFYALNAGSPMTSVAFQGKGYVDDLILSNLDPTEIVHTLVWGKEFGSVSYTVGGAAGESLVGATSPYAFQAPAGSEIILTGSTGYRTFAATNTIGASSLTIALPSVTGISRYFPQTATADQDGTVAHPFEIADVDDLLALQAAVQVTNCADICFVQVADIDFTGEETFAGIGTYADNPTAGVPFAGLYDGQNYTISNVAFTDRAYAGIFNQVNGGTIKNLMVENLFFAGTGEKYSASIIGNAGNGATLQNLVAKGTFGSFGKPGNHNMAGIAIRLSGGGAGTLVKDCTNNAAIYGTYTKMAGICAITQEKVSGGPVTFDGCFNNGNLTMPSGGTAGRDGLAGIVGYVNDDTVLKDCVNSVLRTISSTYADAKIGQLVGCAYDHSLTDLGGNRADYVKKMVGSYSASTITNFQYATFRGGVATTETTLSENNAYLLERDVAASETPVLTLTAADKRVVFYTTLGYTFNGTIAVADPLVIEVSTNDYSITYTARKRTPQNYYDPQGSLIEDSAVTDWLRANYFDQNDIDGLGNDSAATGKLYECFMLNCDFTAEDAGGTLSITDIAVGNSVSITVLLFRSAPLGAINGELHFYGANNLAAGFSRSPIPDESIDFGTGDPTFEMIYGGFTYASVTATFSPAVVTAKFFKAAIEPPIHYEPEETEPKP